jgi:hypothetical protein
MAERPRRSTKPGLRLFRCLAPTLTDATCAARLKNLNLSLLLQAIRDNLDGLCLERRVGY